MKSLNLSLFKNIIKNNDINYIVGIIVVIVSAKILHDKQSEEHRSLLGTYNLKNEKQQLMHNLNVVGAVILFIVILTVSQYNITLSLILTILLISMII